MECLETTPEYDTIQMSIRIHEKIADLEECIRIAGGSQVLIQVQKVNIGILGYSDMRHTFRPTGVFPFLDSRFGS